MRPTWSCKFVQAWSGQSDLLLQLLSHLSQ